MTAIFLINRTPSRITSMKSPCELLFGRNKFPIPPKLFGCYVFVRDHRPSVSKLDPCAVKCIFIGYSSSQKGYKCWNPVERRTFVSMDVTFRESEPFYGEKTDLSALFQDLDYTTVCPEGESSSGAVGVAGSPELQPLPMQQLEQLQPLFDVIPVQQDNNTTGGRWAAEGELQQGRWNNPPQVYARRVAAEEQELRQHAIHGEQIEQPQGEQQGSDDMSSSERSHDEGERVNSRGSIDLPIAVRKGTRAATS